MNDLAEDLEDENPCHNIARNKREYGPGLEGVTPKNIQVAKEKAASAGRSMRERPAAAEGGQACQLLVRKDRPEG